MMESGERRERVKNVKGCERRRNGRFDGKM